MKPATVIFSLILVLMLAFCALFYAGGTLKIDAQSISAEAASYPEACKSIAEVITSGAAPMIFSAEQIGSAADYTLFDINFTLTNRGVFDAEWLNINVEPAAGDVAVYSLSGNTQDVPARSARQANLKLLTRAGKDSKRLITVQYYVYGISRTVKFYA